MQNQLQQSLYSLTLILFITLIMFFQKTFTSTAVTSENCANPLTKLTEGLVSLGIAQDTHVNYTTCSNFTLNRTCCNDNYTQDIPDDYITFKRNSIDYWKNQISKVIDSFLSSYEEFLTWYSTEYTELNTTQTAEDVAYFRLKELALNDLKSSCFEYLWKHKMVMNCYACSPLYTPVSLQPNRTIEIQYSENMCQTIQNHCSDYTRYLFFL